MKDNWEKLFTLNSKSDDIKTIHGIRFINAILIYICHKSTQGLIPTINRTKLSYDSTNPVTILVRICAIYTDAFLCLSGLLVSYSLTKSLNRGNRVSTWREIIARYIRVMPLIISTMLITTFIIPKYAHKRNIHRHLTVDKPSQLCKEFGWRNILMIQNLFNIEEMCNLHTHHVVSDFQLFLIAPFLITLLWKSPKVGVILISGLATISTIARFIVTYVNRLQYFMPFGAILSKCVDTANLLYTKPTHRFTVSVFL
jgi:peptidoglycan/LPS O-acetylase OafA/YrhL